jgi:hypothetical protein
MIWWIENPERSAKERLAIESLAGSVDWVQILGLRMDGTHLCWDADIVTVERLYPITLRYPDHFPGSPPLIFPRGVQERWSYHTNTGWVENFALSLVPTTGTTTSPERKCSKAPIVCYQERSNPRLEGQK